MNLDDKLRKLITDDTMAYEVDEKIAQIKQAFAEDKTWHLDLQTFEKDGQPMMTGQAWYDRFIQELNSGLALPHPAMTKWVEVCARRAANISEDSK